MCALCVNASERSDPAGSLADYPFSFMNVAISRLPLLALVPLLAVTLVSCEDKKNKAALAEAEERVTSLEKTIERLENELKKEREAIEQSIRELQQENNELQKASSETKAQFATLEENVRKAKAELETYRKAHPLE